jgi:hypothetical protein
MRLKRQFDLVDDDTRDPTSTTASNGENPDDRDYDAGESRAGSASPLSVTAPPPTPTSQGLKSKPHTPCPSPLKAAVGLNGQHLDDAAAAERRASERDAALMLMHMRAGSDAGSRASGGSGSRDSGKEGSGSPARSEIVVESGAAGGGSPKDVAGEVAPTTSSTSTSPKPPTKQAVTAGPVTRSKRRRTLER